MLLVGKIGHSCWRLKGTMSDRAFLSAMKNELQKECIQRLDSLIPGHVDMHLFSGFRQKNDVYWEAHSSLRRRRIECRVVRVVVISVKSHLIVQTDPKRQAPETTLPAATTRVLDTCTTASLHPQHSRSTIPHLQQPIPIPLAFAFFLLPKRHRMLEVCFSELVHQVAASAVKVRLVEIGVDFVRGPDDEAREEPADCWVRCAS